MQLSSVLAYLALGATAVLAVPANDLLQARDCLDCETKTVKKCGNSDWCCLEKEIKADKDVCGSCDNYRREAEGKCGS
ncbi:hypothetical protein F5B20DRAFT_530914 [Whalleya microplaca]|nr:hypothetical protein F5B20DRAFT_530914 [Whalleya microplaca]